MGGSCRSQHPVRRFERVCSHQESRSPRERRCPARCHPDGLHTGSGPPARPRFGSSVGPTRCAASVLRPDWAQIGTHKFGIGSVEVDLGMDAPGNPLPFFGFGNRVGAVSGRHNPLVAGSSPAGPTNKNNGLFSFVLCNARFRATDGQPPRPETETSAASDTSDVRAGDSHTPTPRTRALVGSQPPSTTRQAKWKATKPGIGPAHAAAPPGRSPGGAC
jgi:hypothetical protein